MTLPINIDTTYADDGTRPDVALHQQHHDSLHKLAKAGGTTGQVLAKASNTDFDTAWTAPSGGGGGGGQGHKVGAWYRAMNSPVQNNVSAAANRIYAMPVYLGGNIDRIACNVVTAAASATVNLLIYADSNNYPGAVIYDSGALAATATGNIIHTTTTTVTITAGWHWAAVYVGTGAGITLAGSATNMYPFADKDGLPGSSATCHFAAPGSVPNPFTSLASIAGTNAIAPQITLRAA